MPDNNGTDFHNTVDGHYWDTKRHRKPDGEIFVFNL